MARTVEQIHQEILSNIAQNEYLATLNSSSKVAIYRLFAYVVAMSIWVLETLYDKHKIEMDGLILEQKSGTANWYKNLAMRFQFGFDLVTDSDKYNNTGIDDEVIEASKIVKYCSVKRSFESSRLIIKIASQEGDNLIQLTPQQLESFTQYMDETGYEGDKLLIVNNPADLLQLNMVVYRDPLVLDFNGMSILNANKPVELAIRQYLKELKFNGEFVVNDLIEKLRTVPGVINAHIVVASSSHFNTIIDDYSDYSIIDVKVIPESGYFELLNFDSISYVV